MNEPEIRQNIRMDKKDKLYGMYYICRKANYEDCNFSITKEEFDKFEECGLTMEYLHSDGKWRHMTKNEYKEYTGYFRTLDEAEDVLKKYNAIPT